MLCLLQKLFAADINLPNAEGLTPLHIAAEAGDAAFVDVSRWLLLSV
jgi:ankyrin repeat protein